MEGSFAASNTSTINTSTDQHLLIGNILDEGGGVDSSNTKSNHRRSPMRVRFIESDALKQFCRLLYLQTMDAQL